MTDKDANETSGMAWTTESGATYPLFEFDKPQVVKLPNGTVHYFRMPDTVTEKKREDLMKTIVVTSPAIINGEQPRDVKTDFTRSTIRYYEMMVERISGVRFNGNNPTDQLDVKQKTGEMIGDREATILDLIGVAVKKAAASRLYSGRIEVEKPEADDEFEGDPFSEDDLTRAVEAAEKKREVYSLTLDRTIVIKQELGVEAIGNTGRFTDPTHVIRYHFREPSGDEFSKWELKARRGWSIGLKKGGEKAEMFYNLEVISDLFDELIEKIEGASVNGAQFELSPDRSDAGRKAYLSAVPLAVKKLTVAMLFNEMNVLGNV